MVVAAGVRANTAIGTRPRGSVVVTPPEAGEWPNGFKHRLDFQIDQNVIDTAVNDPLIMVVASLATLTENSGLDCRLVNNGGTVLPHRLIKHDGGTVWLRVRLPVVTSEADTAFSLYTGRAAFNGQDVAGLYEGFILALSGETGADMTGQGRDHATTNVTPGTMDDGQPCGVYGATSIASIVGNTPWLNGLGALSVYADLQCDAGADGETRPIWVQSEATTGTAGTLDTGKLTRLAQSSNGVNNPWNAVVRSSEGSIAYAHGVQNSANSNPQIVGYSWSSGGAPALYVDGEIAPTSAIVARGGTIQKLSDGSHMGAGLKGKIAELLVSSVALPGGWWQIDGMSKRRPLALWGVSQPYGPADPVPVIAMPVRANAEAGVGKNIDVLAAATGGAGVSLVEVTQGQRGTVTIESGQARYTATGTTAGADFFLYTLEEADGAQSTGRCDVTISASGVDPEPPPLADELPAPLRTRTATTQAQLDTFVGEMIPGDRIVADMATCTIPPLTRNGTAQNPIVIKAATNQGTRITGFQGQITGNFIRLWGFALSSPTNTNIVSPPEWQGTDGWVIRCRIRSRWRFVRPRPRIWFCDCMIPNNANSRCLEFAIAQGATDYHVYKCYFHDSHNTSGNNFEEMVQCGFGNSQTHINQRGLIEECIFKNINQGNSSAETIGIKGSGVTVLRCTYDNARKINVRHGTNSRIELCYMKGNSGIHVLDANSLVLNNKCVGGADMAVFAGDVAPNADGGNSASWPSAAYPYGFQTLLYNNETAKAPVIGDTFSDASITPLPAKNTVIRGHIGTLPTINFAVGTNPSSERRQAAPYEVEAPIELTQSDIGLFAS